MEASSKKSGIKKILSVVVHIVVYLFFALCMLALVLSVSVKKDADGAVTFFGRQMRIVVSPSMEKCEDTDVSGFEIKDIPVKSLMFIQTVPSEDEKAEEWFGELKTGDVLTFKYVYTRQETITHRITEITQKETGGYLITLAGDNKSSETGALQQTIDTSLKDSPNYVIGKVTGQSRFLGFLISAIKSPVGIVCMIIIPCAIIAVLEVIRIVGVFSSDKKKKQKEEQERKDNELEELKRRLKELENGGRAAEVSAQPSAEAPVQPSAETSVEKEEEK